MNNYKVSDLERKLKATESLLHTMNTLRAECPWDRKQTNESLRNLSIEELYELVDAIDLGDSDMIAEELGDVLLHIVFYCKIGEEKGQFNWADVIEKLVEKLEHRHPHIYGDIVADTEEDVKRNWEQIKLSENKNKDKKKSVLGGVPRSLPAMVKAYRMQEKTAQVGFEWENRADVRAKMDEEIAEFYAEIDNPEATPDDIESEFGDILFSLINLARFYNIEPETALARTNSKFKKRFEYIETQADKPLNDMTLEEMDKLWNEAKGK